MNERLLQYLWNYKIFSGFDFKDTEGNPIEIIDFGRWNFDSGPDFLFGKIKYKNVVLAGNIELHLKSSDYIFHRHSGNPEFENLILHAVFYHDTDIAALQQHNIPTLELKNHIDTDVLQKYESLLLHKEFIPCESIFSTDKIPFGFTEETLLKKLDEKATEIENSLKIHKNNYEAVLFHQLAYAFGLKVNAEIFRQMAESIDFSVLNKIRQNLTQLEALFYGLSGWLDNPEDEQMLLWKREFDFLKAKYQLPDLTFTPKFSKLRPPNFPTVRLSQFAALYHQQQHLFSVLMNADDVAALAAVFGQVKASEYWSQRFSFGKISNVENQKIMTSDFIRLVLINAVLPLMYAYHKNSDENIHDKILGFYRDLLPEKNSVTDRWKLLNVPINNALESQAFLYHYKNFCQYKGCLHCGIGLRLLKETR